MTRPGGVWRNWARTEQVRPRRVEYPPTVDAVRRAVTAAARRGMRVKAVGAGHSFTGIAVAPDVLLVLDDLSGLIDADAATGRARLLAGTRLHRIPALLAPHGLAMANLGDIDRQSLAGAISTGTHGTGLAFGGLGSQVVGATLVTADGELLELGDDDPRLAAVAVGLGALGIIVDVTLQCVPAFGLDVIERPEPVAAVAAEFARRAASVDHLEFYWFPHTDSALIKEHRRLPAGSALHPLSTVRRWADDVLVGGGAHAVVCAAGRLVPATVPSLNRLSARVWGGRRFSDASHRVFASPRVVRFREMEYAVPLERVGEAFSAVREVIAGRRERIEFPLEVRAAAADDRWMSTAYERATGYIAVHRLRGAAWQGYFAAVEEVLLGFDGRPHWGKLHSLDADGLASRYPRFDDFIALRDDLDPHRRFANAYLERVLGE